MKYEVVVEEVTIKTLIVDADDVNQASAKAYHEYVKYGNDIRLRERNIQVKEVREAFTQVPEFK